MEIITTHVNNEDTLTTAYVMEDRWGQKKYKNSTDKSSIQNMGKMFLF